MATVVINSILSQNLGTTKNFFYCLFRHIGSDSDSDPMVEMYVIGTGDLDLDVHP